MADIKKVTGLLETCEHGISADGKYKYRKYKTADGWMSIFEDKRNNALIEQLDENVGKIITLSYIEKGKYKNINDIEKIEVNLGDNVPKVDAFVDTEIKEPTSIRDDTRYSIEHQVKLKEVCSMFSGLIASGSFNGTDMENSVIMKGCIELVIQAWDGLK